jgi:methylmalonyl-CoA/ethylmalonyl-CoA epimerase
MIEIVRVDHLSMAVERMDRQVEFLEGFLGFRPAGGTFDAEGFTGLNLDVPGRSGVGFEVLTPLGRDSYLHRFLEGGHGPGLHHLALQVRDVDVANEAIRATGFEPWGDSGARTERHGPDRVSYIHPARGGHGFLFQLYGGESWHHAEPFEDTAPHTLGIIAINHIAHAHPSREDLGDWYEQLLGFRTVYRSPPEREDMPDFSTRVLEAPTEQMRVEVIQPNGPDSFIEHFLERRGPSMHHLAVEVGDWDRAIAACLHHEIPIFGDRVSQTDGVPWREAFIHPRHTGGILLQFFWQAQPGVWI